MVIGAVLDLVGFHDPIEISGKKLHLEDVFKSIVFFLEMVSASEMICFGSGCPFGGAIMIDTYSRERAHFFQATFKVDER